MKNPPGTQKEISKNIFIFIVILSIFIWLGLALIRVISKI